MKKYYFYLLGAALTLFSFNANAQLVVESTLTVEELVNDVLLGQGVVATNVTFNGVPGNIVTVQAGTFNSANSNVPFETGVILANGNINVAVGPNGGDGSSDPNGFVSFDGDADLELLTGNTIAINDLAIIEFDFIASSDSIRFNYVFASEEYENYVCSGVNDAFGFFVSGPGLSGPFSNNSVNIALIPGGNIPVSINTVNDGQADGAETNCSDLDPNWMDNTIYYVDNNPGDDADAYEFEGGTVLMTAQADVECGGMYHIKLAIGDGGDHVFDSAVFLEEGSFAAFGEPTVNVSPVIGGAAVVAPQYEGVIVAGCSEFGVELARPSDVIVDSLFVLFSGSAIELEDDLSNINEADYVLGVNDTLFFFTNNGSSTDTLLLFSIETLWDGVPNENEVLMISIVYANGCGEYDTTSASLPFVDPYALESITDDVVLWCPSDIPEITADASNGIGPYIYDWGEYGMNQDVIVDVPEDEAYYVVGITDVCGFEVLLDSVLVTNSLQPPLQAVIAPFEQPTCPNEPVLLLPIVQDGNPAYTYVWTNLNGNPISNEETLTAQYIFDTEIILMIIDDCNTIVRDTTTVLYPQYDSLMVSFPALVNNCPSSPIELNAEFTGGAGETEFTWTQLQGEGEFVMSPNEQETEISPSSGVSIYMVTATDRCFRQNYFGLTPGSSFYVDSLRTIDLSNLPNVITPNDDGKNEFFAIAGVEEFKNARLEIFDRWGKLVFETDNYEAGLSDGNYANAFNGKDLNDGTYFYVINVENGECTNSGIIELLRDK